MQRRPIRRIVFDTRSAEWIVGLTSAIGVRLGVAPTDTSAPNHRFGPPVPNRLQIDTEPARAAIPRTHTPGGHDNHPGISYENKPPAGDLTGITNP